MAVLLKKGDVIRLKTGMTVYADLPEDVYYGHMGHNDCCYNTLNKTIHVATRIGKVYHTNPLNENEIVRKVYQYIRQFNSINYEEKKLIYNFISRLGIRTTENIRKSISEFFDFHGVNFTWGDIVNFVQSLNIDYSKKTYDSSIYEGEYVVERVFTTSSPVNPLSPKHSHVCCYKKGNPSIKVDFYQAGDSSPLLHQNIEVVGHVKTD